jgi:electron transfer flavoprotein alpha subunit
MILVIIEQREGKLNRVSYEAITAAQAIAADMNWPIEAAVLGAGVGSIASEIANKKLQKLYAIESDKLEPYTPDSYVTALKQFVSDKQPKLVLMPHTYQVRDFAPQLATALGRTLISDCIGYRKDGDHLLLTRQMFQGKFAADVAFTCDAPWFATFQAGAFRGDQAQDGVSPAPVETVSVAIDAGVVRNKPEAPFKEAKQAVDLTQAEIIVSVGRGIKEQKNIDLAKQLADASDLRCGLASDGPADRVVRANGVPEALSCSWHQRCDSAYRRHEGFAFDHCRKQRCRGADL